MHANVREASHGNLLRRSTYAVGRLTDAVSGGATQCGRASGNADVLGEHALHAIPQEPRHQQEQIDSGEYSSIQDLAQALGVDRTYAGRMLRPTRLAPNTIEGRPAVR